ncbi:RNA-binding S4 domain-containing protein [bacterium]|nr:RNA-binding S4 domain-containing protein [bacterium]
MNKPPLEETRLDRWLMAARFYKTRSQAADACNGRKVKVNGKTAKPHKIIRKGDEITIHHHDRYRDIKVLELADRGLPPALAHELYHEEEKIRLTENDIEFIRKMQKLEHRNRLKYKGRPTKKRRRDMDKFRKNGHTF